MKCRSSRRRSNTWLVLAAGVGLSSCRDLGAPLDVFVPVPTSIVIVAPAPPYRILVGGSLQFHAEVHDQTGAPIAASGIEWTSSIPTVASIDTNGRLLGLGVGQTEIRATSGALSTIPVTAEVIATAGDVATVVILADTDPRVVVGGTLLFVAEARDDQGVVLQVPFNWQSSVPAVATIDTTGLARGVAAGTTEIRASSGSVTSTAVALTVLAQAPDFDTEIQPIFTGRCALSGCHAGASPKEDLRLDIGAAYDEIVGVPSNQLPQWLLVSPGDATASLLYRKVSEDSPPSGSRMPLGAGTLTATEIQRIHDWIDAGAPR